MTGLTDNVQYTRRNDAMPRTRHRLSVLMALFLVVGMLGMIVGCAGAQTPTTTEPAIVPTPTTLPNTLIDEEDTLRMLLWLAPSTLNPYLSVGLKDFIPSRLVYEPLASFDSDGNLVPFLAAEIPSLENGQVAEDGLSVTWTLRKDVQWSDGEPFTADDVVFTYDYVTNPDIAAFASIAYQNVEAVVAVDDDTVRVEFAQPTGAWFVPFTGRFGLILPEHVFAEYNNEDFLDAPANDEPVGTGPYIVTRFTPQEVVLIRASLVETNVITYEPNPFYYGNPPHFQRIVLQGGGTAELATNIMVSGFGDFAYDLGSDAAQREQLEAAGKEVLFNEGSKIILLEMNATDPAQGSVYPDTEHPILSDKLVRDAINLAINRQQIADEVYGGVAEPISNILVLPEEFVSRNTSVVFDPDRARQLLDEAGWVDTDGDGIREKDGVRLELEHQAIIDPLNRQIQDIVNSNLAEVGIETRIEVVDAGIFFGGDQSKNETVEKFRADIQHWDTPMPSIDPVIYFGYWTEQQIPTPANGWVGFNSARWYNERFNELQEQAGRELDPDVRRAMIVEMNDLLVEDRWVLPLVRLADASVFDASLENVQVTPWDAETWLIQDWTRSDAE